MLVMETARISHCSLNDWVVTWLIQDEHANAEYSSLPCNIKQAFSHMEFGNACQLQHCQTYSSLLQLANLIVIQFLHPYRSVGHLIPWLKTVCKLKLRWPISSSSCPWVSNRRGQIQSCSMKHRLVTAKQFNTVSVQSTPWCYLSTSSDVFLSVAYRRLISAALSLSVDHSARDRYLQIVTTSCAYNNEKIVEVTYQRLQEGFCSAGFCPGGIMSEGLWPGFETLS